MISEANRREIAMLLHSQLEDGRPCWWSKCNSIFSFSFLFVSWWDAVDPSGCFVSHCLDQVQIWSIELSFFYLTRGGNVVRIYERIWVQISSFETYSGQSIFCLYASCFRRQGLKKGSLVSPNLDFRRLDLLLIHHLGRGSVPCLFILVVVSSIWRIWFSAETIFLSTCLRNIT